MTAEQKREQLKFIAEKRQSLTAQIKALQLEANKLGEEAEILQKELDGQRSLLPFSSFSEARSQHTEGL